MEKNVSLFILFLALKGILFSQSYNNPESIVYDKAYKRYLISNKGGNTIVQLDSENTLENFVSSGLDSPKGLLIVGDTLISVNNTSIKGFRLSDANPIMNIPISGSIFMNDVAYNGKGTLYLSDSEKDVIYRLKITDRTYSTLISSGINPNGLFYDEKTNSLLICSSGENAKIQSYNFSDSTLETRVITKFSNLDGLAKDNCGNIYVSSWGEGAVYVFDSLLLKPPTVVSIGHNGPADISINPDEQILAVPNFNSNSISLLRLGAQPAVQMNYITPINNSIDLDDSLKMDWEDVSYVTGYELQYSTDSTFTNLVVSIQTINSETVINGLASNTKYFWRVRTLGGNYKSIFSDPWNFTVTEHQVF